MKPLCLHHWMLPTPDGSAYLEAECRACGEKRMMPASDEAAGNWKEHADRTRKAAQRGYKKQQEANDGHG